MNPSRSAVVTGGARGIGRSIAEMLVRQGYQVVVTDVNDEQVRRTAAEIGAAAGVVQDVRQESAHAAVATKAAELGELVVWVNNAGVAIDGRFDELSSEAAQQLVDVNFLGTLWGVRAALATFGPGGGDIVNIASVAGLGPTPELGVYAATKAAVVSLTMTVNVETPKRVRLHALCPDGADTAMVAGMAPDGIAKALVHSSGRLLSVEEVARAAVALIGSRRVVRSLPGWRGGMIRGGALAPSISGGAFILLRSMGRRVIRKRS